MVIQKNFFQEASRTSQQIIDKENRSIRKPKKHHGKFESYDFDKESFLDEVKALPRGHPINWTRLAKKYDVKCKGVVPGNAGQVLQAFAKCNGVNVFNFALNKRLSGRDYARRIRRQHKKIKVGKTKVSLPAVRAAKELKQEVRSKIEDGQIDLGEKVVPKNVTINKIEENEITATTTVIYGRRYKLDNICNEELKRFNEMGITRQKTSAEYLSMNEEDVKKSFQEIHEEIPTTTVSLESKANLLEKIHKRLHLKIWHDHSGILNHSYVAFMVSFLYDVANFLTDEEYKQLYPEKKPISVQAAVEIPRLYIFGQSST